MRSEIKQQAELLIAIKRAFSENPELFQYIYPVVMDAKRFDEILSDAGATVSSLIWAIKRRPLKSMTPDELRECIHEPGFTDNYCLMKINSFDSVYQFYTFMAQFSKSNTLQWLYDHGFEIFKIIE